MPAGLLAFSASLLLTLLLFADKGALLFGTFFMREPLGAILMQKDKIFAGLSGVEMTDNQFDLGQGIYIRKTYAHLFAPFMVAFNPPGKFKHHDGPWKATKGGLSFDINVELEIPSLKIFDSLSGQEEGSWLLAFMLRLASYPFINVAAISDMPFREVTDESSPTIYPFETKHRIFTSSDKTKPIISENDLMWLKDHWEKTAELLIEHPELHSAFKAFDFASIQGKSSTSLLSVWGAIEHLFSYNMGAGEIKYRVCFNLASYLTEDSEKRDELYKELSKLYKDRSKVAHTSKDIEHSPLISSYVHLRNAFIKIIQTGAIPT